MAKVLVVGGAGYVGSATCAWLVDQGHEVTVLDDLSTGHYRLNLGSEFIRARAGDRPVVPNLLSKEKFDCVMHFAAKSLVAESVLKPDEYRENNVVQTRELLEMMLEAGITNFIFSSTCAIFGDPGNSDISETLPKKPINPYGQTKLEVEQMLEGFAERGLRSIALRYFNAAGAEPKLRVGEVHEPETHLIPRVLQAAVDGTPIEIFGTDYPTPDGTCVRDYIHVYDLAAAHGAAMIRLVEDALRGKPGQFSAFNLGSEKGFSVREVIRKCEEVTGHRLNVVESPRRKGDPPRLVADSSRARKALGFKPQYTDLSTILSTAWNWKRKEKGLLKRAIFLDRDGTLNEDPGYLSEPSQLKLFGGVPQALGDLRRAGFLLVVVSNQSGVARGLISEDRLPLIHEKMDELLKPWGAGIDHYELCTHLPQDACACRKPKPKLILDAALSLGIDLSQSYMVGDKLSDLGAGRAAGVRGVALVRTGEGMKTETQIKKGDVDFIGNSLADFARWILSPKTANS